MGALIGFFLSPIGRLIGVGALAFIIGGVGAGWAVSTVKNGEIASIKGEQARANAAALAAALATLQKQQAEIVAQAQDYGRKEAALNVTIAGLKDDIGKIHFKTPLPVGCRSTPDRLRNLTAAVRAANQAAASGQPSGPTVPPAH